jgi:hypothetical protein
LGSKYCLKLIGQLAFYRFSDRKTEGPNVNLSGQPQNDLEPITADVSIPSDQTNESDATIQSKAVERNAKMDMIAATAAEHGHSANKAVRGDIFSPARVIHISEQARTRNTARNREIMALHLVGASQESLAISYGISAATISGILLSEANKRKYNTHPYYKALRSENGLAYSHEIKKRSEC